MVAMEDYEGVSLLTAFSLLEIRYRPETYKCGKCHRVLINTVLQIFIR